MRDKRDKKYRKPTIVKLTQQEYSGMISHRQNRDAIGFVIRGKKYLYDGDRRKKANCGEVFYLPKGNRYIENIPDGDRPYEEIVFYYKPEEMSKIISRLSARGFISIKNDHICDDCADNSGVSSKAWSSLKIFFDSTNQYFKSRLFIEHPIAEELKLAELAFLIALKSDCCIKRKIVETTDSSTESFEEIIHNNIFENITIEELAKQTNMSLTTFKNEFRRRFQDSPHRWLTRQRLMHAHLLLLSTNDTVADIGEKCSFSNTSHFIKVFKKEFKYTPAAYRRKHEEERKKRVKQTEKTARELIEV